ncbi:hypothetical protein [Allorhizocola rhizosphaerae]|uniref:hypothetical protein n=1 Tax=Allorhizocola rhizosphaerae TaxID=1872709 RepID=UPI0013C3112E|nr:hypothetical protein [Allorhizocola rhizosphaerae]
MTNVDKPESGKPVTVTGDERAHPAMRLLARACVELARLKLSETKHGKHDQSADEAAAQQAGTNTPSSDIGEDGCRG